MTVIFDAGTSGSKVIASYPSGECPYNDEGYFLIKPSVRALTEYTYRNWLEDIEGDIGLDSSVVSYIAPVSGERVYWEVGELASSQGFLFVDERKFETLLVKILALLGYLVDLSARDKKQIRLNLGVLLPLDEIEDRALLASWLRKIIEGQGFLVNGKPIENINIDKINFRPEGSGIYRSFPNDKAGILVIGHSDLSWLFFHQGKFISQCSHTFPGSGMHSFLRELKFPIQYELLTAELIAKAGVNPNLKVLLELTQTKSDDEISHLTRAIKVARVQYWHDRTKEIGSLKIGQANQVCVIGGAANYFSTELTQFFKEKYGIKLNWCKSLAKEFSVRFDTKASNKLNLLFLDCFGYYKSFSQVKTVVPSIDKPKLKVVKSASN